MMSSSLRHPHWIQSASFVFVFSTVAFAQSEFAQATFLEPEKRSLSGENATDEMADSRLSNLALADLAHLVGGEWRTSLANGSEQRDRWAWGPAKRSLTSVTTNSEATGESTFGSFRVIFHHPQRDELVVLALAGQDLLQSGTLVVKNKEEWRFDMTLFYDQKEIAWAIEPTRKISSDWDFKTLTEYTNSWVRDMGRPVEPGSVAWTYTRHGEISPLPVNVSEPPDEINHLGTFLPLLETDWESKSTRTTFSWIPYNEAILIRSIDKASGKLTHESVVYPHPITKTVHMLTIHASGEVDEGVVTTEDGAIVVRSSRSDQNGTVRIEQRLERVSGGVLRVNTLLIEDSVRKPVDETVFRVSGE